MKIRIFSPFTRTGLLSHKCDTIRNELAAVDSQIERREAQRDAISAELSELKGIRTALSDCLQTLTIDATVAEELTIEPHLDELAIDYQHAAE